MYRYARAGVMDGRYAADSAVVKVSAPLKVRKRVAFWLDDLPPMFDGAHHLIQAAACLLLGHTPIVDGFPGKPYWVQCAYCSKELE